jgi:hypothetical protein
MAAKCSALTTSKSARAYACHRSTEIATKITCGKVPVREMNTRVRQQHVVDGSSSMSMAQHEADEWTQGTRCTHMQMHVHSSRTLAHTTYTHTDTADTSASTTADSTVASPPTHRDRAREVVQRTVPAVVDLRCITTRPASAKK